MTIVEFLTARYDEEEAVVLAAIKDDGGQDGGLEDAFDRLTKSRNVAGPLAFEPRFGEPLARMIVRNTPRRALADLASKRAILAEYGRIALSAETYPNAPNFSSLIAMTTVVRLLAQPFADHPDYDPAWAAEVKA